jgi:hypothetical protein
MGVARLRMLPPATQLALAFQQLPRDTPLCPIAHEIVHHVAANSAVNVAMQGRWLQLMRRTLSSPFLLAAADDYRLAIGLAQAEALLQPIAEGLAIFAECDCAIPTRAGYARDPQLRTGVTDCMMFRLLACKAGVGAELDTLAAVERDERLSAAHVDRKTSILSNPFRPVTANDSYLVGYLGIKALWERCVATRPAGQPPLRATAFLRYVHYFFYEDWPLAEAIVGDDFQGAVAGRLEERYRALLASDVAALVEAFDVDITQRTGRGMLARGVEELTHGPFDGLGLTREELRGGMMALAVFESSQIGPAAPVAGERALPQNLHDATHAVLMQPMPDSPPVEEVRRRLRLASDVPVRLLDLVLDVPQKKRPLCLLIDLAVACRAASADVLTVTTLDGSGTEFSIRAASAASLGGGTYEARLAAVVTSTACPWRVTCLLIAGGGVLASWSHGMAPDGEELQRIWNVLSLQDGIESATPIRFDELATVFGTVLATEQCAQAADIATQHACEALREAMAPRGWGSLFAPTHERSEFGLRSVMSRSELRALAAVGLCNAFTSDAAEVARLLAGRGYDLEALREGAARVQVEHGLELLDVGDGRLRARV